MTVFYNTISAPDNELTIYTAAAQCQNDKVLEFFKANKGKLFTPDEVHGAVFSDKVPLTSCRRSIFSLTDAGHLIKTDKMRMGRYGKPVHCWTVKGEMKQSELF